MWVRCYHVHDLMETLLLMQPSICYPLSCSGTQDFVVPFRMAEKSQQAVQAKGCQSYTIKSYPIGHTIAQDEMADVLRFIKTSVPDDETCRVQLKDPTEMSIKELKAAIRKAGLDHKAVGLMEKHEFVKLVQESRK